MIALKLVFQSLAGVAAVGSVASGGYYMFNIGEDQFFLVSLFETSSAPSKDLFTDEPPKTSSVAANSVSSLFLAVNSGDSSDSSSTAGGGSVPGTNATSSKPLAEAAKPNVVAPAVLPEKEKTQNYTCKSQDKKTEDKECKLFSIAFDQTNKSIDLSAINAFIKEQAEKKVTETQKITKTINKSDLTSKHFFILKSSSSFVTQQMLEGKNKITLASTAKDTNDKDKSYATLTVLANFKDEKAIGKTNVAVVIATAVDTVTTNLTIPSESKTYTCTLQNSKKTELKDCLIQDLTSYSDSQSFNFSSTTLSATQTALTIAKDKHYLIKWTDKEKISSLNQKIHFALKQTAPLVTPSSTTKPAFTELSPISRLIVQPTTGSTFSEVIIIK